MFESVKKIVKNLIGGPDTELVKDPEVIGPEVHGIDPELVSWQARRTCEILQGRGFKAYIVGGAVRDLLLGVRPKDFDVATNATPEQIKRSQRRAYIIGRRFRLVHVVYGQEVIECSTFRALDSHGVRKDDAGRVISDNVFGPMWQDAARRDFTINALYYDPVTEKVYDYHRGFKDIRRKCLRMIGDPLVRYREDPVRMMRAVRIASKLDFKIESRTEESIAKMAKLLANVPAARLFDEMMKLFTSGAAEKCLLRLRENHLHKALLPMLDVILDEPEGEKFLMLALKRTDERIAIGKKISPSFLFGTLLWPQVKKRWDYYQENGRMIRATALFAASEDVLRTQCQQLAIQNRFVSDIKMIWMLQLRFERRTGKNPYSLIEHPRYRAAFDFMQLRSSLGHVPTEMVTWWEHFVAADEQTRAEMIEEVQKEVRKTAAKARAGHTSKTKSVRAENEAFEAIESETKKRRRRPAHRNRTKAEKSSEV